jgi:hypothetical protein
MITLRLLGGLGNQMFQYAAAKSLASRLDSPLLLDVHEFEHYADRNYDLHVFPEVKEKFCDKAQHNLLYSKSKIAKLGRIIKGVQIYEEPDFYFDPEFLRLTAPINLSGYFQSEKYFLESEKEIRTSFKWDERRLSESTRAYLQSIKAHHAISVHFRRGDYVSNQKTSEVHGTCDRAYYQNAIDFVIEKFSDSHFFVFSDDIEWVKSEQYFAGLDRTYVEKSDDMHDSEEMFLMSQCRHNIVANSSFSWWGAWLNSAANKVVVAPQNWFNANDYDARDLIPESWFRR